MRIEIMKLDSVRVDEPDFPPRLVKDEETGEIYLRAINEGGFSCVDIHLRDLLRSMGIDCGWIDKI